LIIEKIHVHLREKVQGKMEKTRKIFLSRMKTILSLMRFFLSHERFFPFSLHLHQNSFYMRIFATAQM
jgi:hypothetical protein